MADGASTGPEEPPSPRGSAGASSPSSPKSAPASPYQAPSGSAPSSPLPPATAISPKPIGPTALNWLSLQRGSQVAISAEAQSIFRQELGHVNMVMLCGKLRTGKSYLANALLQSQCFGVSSQCRSFTKGLNISPRLIPSEWFGCHEGGPSIAMCDLEGQGDKGVAQDVKLAAPPLLLSKAVVLLEVCPTGPSKEVLLESLQVMMRAAEFLSDRKERNNIFGNLHVVLRDCPQAEEEIRSIVFDLESTQDADTDEHASAINRRNEVRQAIEHAFESRPRVWCLPKLSDDTAPEDYRHAAPGFSAKVDELRAALGEQLATPKLIWGQPLTGALIAALMPELAKELSSGAPALNPPSLMERVNEVEIARAGQEFAYCADLELAALGRRLPLAPNELRREVEALVARLRGGLEERLAIAAGSPRVADARAALQSRVALLDERLHRRNNELLNERAIVVCADYSAKVQQHFAGVPPNASEGKVVEAARKATSIMEELDGRLDVFAPTLGEVVRTCVVAQFDACQSRATAAARERRLCRRVLPAICVMAFCALATGAWSISNGFAPRSAVEALCDGHARDALAAVRQEESVAACVCAEGPGVGLEASLAEAEPEHIEVRQPSPTRWVDNDLEAPGYAAYFGIGAVLFWTRTFWH